MAEVAIARNFFWLLLFWLGTHHLDSAVKPEQCMALHASAAASAAFFVVPEAKTVLVLKAKKKKKVTVPSRTALVGVAWQSETECARGFRREQHWKTQVVQHCSKVRQRRLGQCRWKLLHLQRCKDDCRFDKGGGENPRRHKARNWAKVESPGAFEFSLVVVQTFVHVMAREVLESWGEFLVVTDQKKITVNLSKLDSVIAPLPSTHGKIF